MYPHTEVSASIVHFNFILLQGCEFAAQPCHHHACSKQSSYNLITTLYVLLQPYHYLVHCKQPCLSLVKSLLQACTSLLHPILHTHLAYFTYYTRF